MKISLLAVFILVFGLITNAQDVKGLIKSKANSTIKKAGKKVEKEIGEEVEKGTEKAVDKQIDKMKSKNEDGTENDESPESANAKNNDSEEFNPLSMMNSGDPAKYEQSYSFDGSFTMLMNSWDNKGKQEDPIEYTSYFSENAESFGFEFVPAEKKKKSNEKSVFIYDYKNKSMIIAGDDGEAKSGMVMAIPEIDEDMYDEDLSEETEHIGVDFKKTGKTKTILGYLCEEYYHKDEEEQEEISMWLTDNINIDRAKLYGNMETFKVAGSNTGAQGFMMEMETKNLKNQERSHVVVTSIDLNKKTTVGISDYQLINMGSTKMPGQK